jgi:L-ascorbate metabolism protein UlaG (beta-lactamase superfamily)
MRVTWLGHGAFLLAGEGVTVGIDPYGDVDLSDRGWRFDYPPLEGLTADLVHVTHEHADHAAVEAFTGDPPVIRSTAGRFASPAGEVLAVAAEHDDRAGTVRGPNTIFRVVVGGISVCHLGDLGQSALRPEQRAALGDVDVLLVPVGGGPTLDGPRAAAVAEAIAPRLVIPMHHRTDAADFLDPPDAFLEAFGRPVTELDSNELEVEPLLAPPGETAVVLLRRWNALSG